MILITRFDIDKYLPKKQAHCMIVVVQKWLKADCVKVLYIKKSRYTVRYQTNHYDIEKVIQHFEDRIKTNDSRFMKSWERNLRVAIKMKKEML